MKNNGRKAGLALAVLIGLGGTGCTDLLTEPRSTVSSGTVFEDADSYESLLAKVYAGLAVTGQRGPDGRPDIASIDEGFSQYIRAYWQLQELPTDEAVVGWTDPGLPVINTAGWTSANEWTTAMYYRIYFQIAMTNVFLRETSDEALGRRGHQGIAEIPQFRAEARALRALSYYHGMDMYGDIPLIEEDFAIDELPQQATRTQIFDFVEAELLDVVDDLPAMGAAEYGRLDQGFVRMVLAKIYLNAEVYGAGDRSADAVTQTGLIISSGAYELDDDFHSMFLADNHTSPEFIFAVPFDGTRTQTWGGTTFLVHGAVGDPNITDMEPSDYGIDFGWGGLRVTQQFVALYEDGADGPDDRSDILFTSGQDSVVATIPAFTDGYAFPKYQNVTSTGDPGSHLTHTDADFPMFRLADAMLMYAEACYRSGGGACAANAETYVNEVRERAYGDTGGNVDLDAMTSDEVLAFLLDERGRELAWEAHRRQDLIRYDLFSGTDYVWAFKGGVAAGGDIPDTRNLFPIPANELIANPTLEQNPGY
jgi:hypothetical protein